MSLKAVEKQVRVFEKALDKFETRVGEVLDYDAADTMVLIEGTPKAKMARVRRVTSAAQVLEDALYALFARLDEYQLELNNAKEQARAKKTPVRS